MKDAITGKCCHCFFTTEARTSSAVSTDDTESDVRLWLFPGIMCNRDLDIICKIQFTYILWLVYSLYAIMWLFISRVRLIQEIVFAKQKMLNPCHLYVHMHLVFHTCRVLAYVALIHLYNIINFWLVSLLCGLFLMQLSELVSRETIERLRKLCQSLFVWIMNMTW